LLGHGMRATGSSNPGGQLSVAEGEAPGIGVVVVVVGDSEPVADGPHPARVCVEDVAGLGLADGSAFDDHDVASEIIE
jgi:hypothetical protein